MIDPTPKTPGKTLLDDAEHRAFLKRDALEQFRFFDASLGTTPGYYTLDFTGKPMVDMPQELHTTTRLVHSYALGMLAGVPGSDAMVDKGMNTIITAKMPTGRRPARRSASFSPMGMSRSSLLSAGPSSGFR